MNFLLGCLGLFSGAKLVLGRAHGWVRMRIYENCLFLQISHVQSQGVLLYEDLLGSVSSDL